jgi:outer membrane protein assembly factor BamC
MMAKIKLAVTMTVATAIALSIVGCTSNTEIRNRSNDYLYSDEIPEMEVSDDKDDTAVGELYVIPDIPIAGSQATTFNVPRPQPPSENLFEESVKIQAFDGKRWISINKPPAEVWPRLRNILTRSGVPTTRTDAPNGILETGWLQFKDDLNNSHRFRFTIVPGVGVKSTEIQLTQMEAVSGSENSVSGWPESSMSDNKEEEFTKIVANALVSDINSGSVSLLAQNIGGESKVEVVIPEKETPYIAMGLGYDRAWVSVMNALSLGGFSVVDQHQSEGSVLVDFNDTPVVEDDDTLFGLISGFLNEGDDLELKALEYKVKVIQGEKNVEVRIMERDGSMLDSLLATKLLKVIRANLS